MADEPTLSDVLRRLDAIDRDLVSIDRRFNATDTRLLTIDARLDLMATLAAEFRKETLERLDVLLGAVADVGDKITRHIAEGH